MLKLVIIMLAAVAVDSAKQRAPTFLDAVAVLSNAENMMKDYSTQLDEVVQNSSSYIINQAESLMSSVTDLVNEASDTVANHYEKMGSLQISKCLVKVNELRNVTSEGRIEMLDTIQSQSVKILEAVDATNKVFNEENTKIATEKIKVYDRTRLLFRGVIKTLENLLTDTPSKMNAVVLNISKAATEFQQTLTNKDLQNIKEKIDKAVDTIKTCTA